jgi:hypothetical protein
VKRRAVPVDPDVTVPVSPQVHYGQHVIRERPDPACPQCAERAVWAAGLAARSARPDPSPVRSRGAWRTGDA